MIVINTISNERFSLDGVEYFKNFLSFVLGNKVAIYNAYDSRDQRINAALYSEFIVNGVVYETAILLQQALLGVIYTRDSLAIESFRQVNTYSELLLVDNPYNLLIIKVLNDENKGMTNTIYNIYPDGTRMWMAAVED